MAQDPSRSVYFERQVTRLMIVLYHCGQPTASLLDGEARQIESLAKLQRFDFWVREPGHLTLALLHAYSETPAHFEGTVLALRETIDRVLTDNNADYRRVIAPGTPYHIFEDFAPHFSFLTSRALVSDRPSFVRSRNHHVILETMGVKTVKQILESCPAYSWYRQQCEAVAMFLPILDLYDLNSMIYLAPDLTPSLAASRALIPYIRQRYVHAFGEPVHADVRKIGPGDSAEASVRL
jgi:hypothetical protein